MAETLLVSDIGDVLISTSQQACHEALADLSGVDRHEVVRRINSSDAVPRFEQGHLSVGEFTREIAECLGCRGLTHRDVRHCWDALLGKPVESMISAVRLLDEVERLVLASNTNEVHWERVSSILAQHCLHSPAVLSFEVGALKPHPDFYEVLIDRYGNSGVNLLFVDDKLENVDAARRCGIDGWVHSSSEQSVRRITALLDRPMSEVYECREYYSMSGRTTIPASPATAYHY